jgi:hypothetical protein
LLSRAPTPVGDYNQRSALYNHLLSDDAAGKFRIMRLLQVYVGLLHDSQDPGAMPVMNDFILKLRKVQTAGITNLVAWQRYLLTAITSGDDQTAYLNALAKDEAWQQRLLALVAARSMGPTGSQVADQLASDPDPLVRQYALGVQQAMQAAPKTPTDTTDAPASLPPLGNAKE